MTYQMTADLMTGNAIIDSEHRKLFDAINQLLDACSKGQGRTQIAPTMNFLVQYINTHFAHEEQLQQKTGYPEFAKHKMLHDGYKRVVADIMQELSQNGVSIALVAKVNTNIAGWLINHIRIEDFKVAKHIKNSEK